MTKKDFIVRNITRSELDTIIDWAAKEGWNPGLHDADSFYLTDPNGFFVGFLDNEPIACISAVAYNKSFGFLGFYITKPKFRGQGYGIQVWNKAMAYLKTQNIGLDGVVAQQENYKKAGFKLAYSNIRFQSETKHTAAAQSKNIKQISMAPFAELEAYDARCFPVVRQRFLKSWISMPDSFGFVNTYCGKITGYGVIRKCHSGYKIGPLFANTPKIALSLYESLCNQVAEGSSVILDVPEVNQPAIKLAEGLKMTKVFGTARMYSKSPPKIALDKIFGITTFEVG
jgi:ribosomal protein S18 acetylase RimI-like enzyme